MGGRGWRAWPLLAAWLFWLGVGLAADRLVILQTTDVHAHDDTWPRLATLIRAEREAAGAESVLLIDCGDTCQGTLVGAATQGAADIAALNALAYDVWIPGNHEFDFGGARFRELVGSCRATILAANLAGPRPSTVGEWRLFERAGRRIAVIGLTSPHLAEWFMPADLDGLHALPLRETIERILPQVMAAAPDLIVLAIHHGRYNPARLGGEDLYDIVRDYPQIHLVLGGHSHEPDPGSRLAWHGWFVQAGQHGEHLARIEVKWPPEPGAAPLIASRLQPTADVIPDAALAAVLRSSHPAAVSPPFARVPAGMTSTAFLAHLGRALCQAAGTDAALVQPVAGELLPPEDFDDAALFRIMPFENHIWRIDVAPDELAELLAEQRRQSLRRHVPVSVDGLIGTPADPPDGKRISLAVSNYALAGGGGRLPVLRRLGADPACRARPAGTTVRTAIRDHFQRMFPR
jgi:2',3'-cyclic-nucleotide 2'-phosphodiesterase (5'-nucleotidase family)